MSREDELQEVADGAYGDNPAIRGAARDMLKRGDQPFEDDREIAARILAATYPVDARNGEGNNLRNARNVILAKPELAPRIIETARAVFRKGSL